MVESPQAIKHLSNGQEYTKTQTELQLKVEALRMVARSICSHGAVASRWSLTVACQGRLH